MPLFTLILRNTGRHPLRTLLTVAGIAVAISAFGLIRTVIGAWYGVADATAANRLITRNAISLVFPLPLAYQNALRAIPGINRVTFATWFGGIYIDERHSQFGQMAVDPATWLSVYPEFVLPPEQQQAFGRERNAAVIGIQLAERFGWKLGDTIRLRGTIFSGDWDLVVRGIYRGARRATDESNLFFHWDYLNERVRQIESWRADYVGWYVLQIGDPNASGSVAQAIDERFTNSVAETQTETEKAFVQGFVAMSATILAALKIISFVIIGVILLVLSNTMAMTARERLPEFAVLKTLGFGAAPLALLIGGESVLLGVFGGALGIALTFPAAHAFGAAMRQAFGGFFPVVVTPETVALCTAMALGVGLAAAIIPVWRAVTLSIVAGLRKVG